MLLLSDLSHHGLIKVHGEDAESFLQNQLTNDIRNVTGDTFQVSAWCSPKGRIIVSFGIFKYDDAYYLSLSQDLIEKVVKKLRMYIMMSKVTVEDVTQSMSHYGISGDSIESGLDGLLSNSSAVMKVRAAGDIPRYEMYGDKGELSSLVGQLEVAPEYYWDYLNIVAGQPSISLESSEAWIPQMVNLVAVEGVDFKKGCYPGQEVVARLNYLGKTKRRMYRIQADSDQLPEIGESISSEDDADAGKILNAVINPEGKVEALAVMKIAEASKALSLKTSDVSILELPYSVVDE